MGIINVTPDSFSDGGQFVDPQRAVDAGVQMVADGADVLDVGGESTRPGADAVGEKDELRRVLPVIEGLAARVTVPISIDTYKPAVADAALGAGATLVNDISGLRYAPDLATVVARRRAAVVLMHTRGRSREMYKEAVYNEVVDEVLDELRESVAFATGAIIFFLPGETSFGRRLAELSSRRPSFDLAYTAGALVFSGALVLAGKYSPFLYFRF